MDYITHQVLLSTEFIKQEYWSGLPFPPPGYLPDPGIELASPALAGGFFTTEPLEKPVARIRVPLTACFLPAWPESPSY